MMDMEKFEALLKHMTLEELREANRRVVNRINAEHTIRNRAQLARFDCGDVVEFVLEREGRIAQMRVERLNTKTVSGREIPTSGCPGKQWRVSPTLCRKVTAPPLPAPPLRNTGFVPSAPAGALSF